MTKILTLLLLISFAFVNAEGNKSNKKIPAQRVSNKIKIDGIMDEIEWQKAIPATDFIQMNPLNGVPPTFQTEVKFIYDNTSLYVGAFMYDDQPDSIATQLGDRDDALNADRISIKLDTYNSKIDAFHFDVYASGVQKDYRYEDDNFNAVWESNVKIVENGWVVEMRIPFSAFRFPEKENQTWTIQILREIRRIRETSTWNFIPRDVDNFMNYWGDLENLQNIEPPVRLSLSPYLSMYGEHFPYNDPNINNYGGTISGGMDLKYGLNAGLTLDLTLLPDFSAVQSDNLVKNLGAFEVIYQENRPFFQEGTELFNYGDMFYSRRIGGSPINQSKVYDALGDNDEIISNPNSTRLLNASKISGRLSNGVGVGFFNAITAPTYATIRKENGDLEEIETSPLVNYNISVVDKNLGNNNNAYLINTNVIRNGETYDANVTGAGFTLNNKKNTYMFDGDVSYSHKTDGSKDGTEYWTSFNKTSGKYKFNVASEGTSKHYDMNDLSFTFQQGVRGYRVTLQRGQFEPWWVFNNGGSNLSIYASQQWDSLALNMINISSHNYGLLKKHFTFIWFGANVTPTWYYDYWEPRVDGRYVKLPGDQSAYFGFSTNYAKPLAIDGNFNFTHSKWYNDIPIVYWNIEPIIRFSDKFQMRHMFEHNYIQNFVGFATIDEEGNSIFGERNNQVFTNTLSAKYLFKNNLSLNLRVRHYWSEGYYNNFYQLQNDGSLIASDYNGNEDFSFNVFNVDAVLNWQFAPGSFVTLTYKNAIINGDEAVFQSYIRNLTNTLNMPQRNSIALKLLYYIDYEQVMRLRK